MAEDTFIWYYFEKETQQIKPIYNIKCLKIETSYQYLVENRNRFALWLVPTNIFIYSLVLIYNLVSNVFLFFHLSSPTISPKLGFCVISSPVAFVIWITAWLRVAYCTEPKLFTLIFKIRHTFSLVYISPLSTLLSPTSFILLLSLSHPMLFYPVLSCYTFSPRTATCIWMILLSLHILPFSKEPLQIHVFL